MTNKPTVYFTIAIVVIMVAVLWFLFFGVKKEAPKMNSVDYNYFTFTEIGGLWHTEIKLNGQVFEAPFRFNPTQVEDVYVSGSGASFSKQPIYITFDPNASSDSFKYTALAAAELSLHIARALNKSVAAACTSNATDECVDRPIVDCDSNESVIYLSPVPPAQITLNNNCVVLSGYEFDLLKSVDRLLFQWYNIWK